jgi:hypothetical protein
MEVDRLILLLPNRHRLVQLTKDHLMLCLMKKES